MALSKRAVSLSITVVMIVILGLAVVFLGFNILFKGYAGVKEQTEGAQQQVLGTTCRDPGAGLLSDAKAYQCACTVYGGQPSSCVQGRVKEPSQDCPVKCDKGDSRRDYEKTLKTAKKEFDAGQKEGGSPVKLRTVFGECCAVDDAGNVIG